MLNSTVQRRNDACAAGGSTIKIKKIIAPTDLSEASEPGLRYALELAKAEGAEVVVVHVIGIFDEWLARHDDFDSVGRLVEKRRKMLAEFLERGFAQLLSQIPLRQEAAIGVPWQMIVEKAGEERADLIIMSTHGWSGLSHALIGSVTEKVVNRASCPVLSIHPKNLKRQAWPPNRKMVLFGSLRTKRETSPATADRRRSRRGSRA